MSEKKIYFNKPQRLTQLIGANTTVIVAGRRTGKTDSIAAPFALRNMQRMPGSTGGIVVFYLKIKIITSALQTNRQKKLFSEPQKYINRVGGKQ